MNKRIDFHLVPNPSSERMEEGLRRDETIKSLIGTPVSDSGGYLRSCYRCRDLR